ncbi:MAG: DUF1573 domain-containing protein [Planctomycetaceae bacterium]
MNANPRLAITVSGALFMAAGAIWLARQSDQQTLHASLVAASEASNQAKIPDGEGPRADVASFKHDFGQMAVGDEKRHVFTIRNTGRQPLKLEAGETSCKCTLSKLDRGELASGESANVELVWTPDEPAEEFKQMAVIHTNDPKRSQLRFAVTGRVVAIVAVTPSKAWQIGEVLDGKATEVSGAIYSEARDGFKLLKVSTSSPHITASFEPLSATELERLKARSGYAVRTLVSPEIPVGPFDEKLTLETDVPGREIHSIDLYGERPGPLRLIGKRWSVEERTFHLGNFSAADGRAAKLSVFLRNTPWRETSLVVLGTSDKHLKATVERDREFASEHQSHFPLTIEVPPGSPISKRDRDEPAWIELRSNVPGCESFKLTVNFNAY